MQLDDMQSIERKICSYLIKVREIRRLKFMIYNNIARLKKDLKIKKEKKRIPHETDEYHNFSQLGSSICF